MEMNKSPAAFATHTGGMYQRVHAFDWGSTPLGPMAGWSASLRALAELVLASPTPQYLAWGPDHRFIYNDGYVGILGARHPAALGQPLLECWPEIADELRPLLARTLSGEPSCFENHRFVVERNGFAETTWFSFSYTPLRDDGGQVAGIHCALFETTAKVLAERSRADEMQRLQRLLEQAPAFMAVLQGPLHEYKIANAAYRRFVGRDDLIGKPVRQALPELEGQGYIELLDRVYATAEPYVGARMRVELQREPGIEPQSRYVDFVFQPVVEDDGTCSGIFIQGVDVTDHVCVESELLESGAQAHAARRNAETERTRLHALLDAAPVGIGYADLEGRLTLVNAANREIWGDHPLPDNSNEYVVWKGWWADGSARHGQPIAPHEWGLARALRGENVPGDLIEIEPFGKPGTRRNVLLRASPIRTEDEVSGAVVTQVDITDRIRAEVDLRNSEAKFRTIADAMPQMVWSTLPDGFHDYYNRQWYQYTGVPEGSTDGEGWNGMFHPDEQDLAWRTWRHSLATGEPYQIEYRLRHHTGQYRWVVGRALPVRDDHGRIVRWMGTCTDIHEQMLAQAALQSSEEALREADRRKDEFLAMLAHELRNPLAPISTAAQLLQLAPGDETRVRHSSEIIARQVSHMTGLVDDLLDVSRLTRGLVKLDLEILDLRTVVSSAIEQVRPLLEARQHLLTTTTGESPAPVRGDRTRLIQVVANLLNNAAKYTPTGGRIALSIDTDADSVRITVQDDGNGIDAALMPHIFELFTQAVRAPDRSQGGLGIGLALVRSIASLHGGHVHAASGGPQQGSVFTLTLPLAPLDAALADHRSTAPLARGVTSTRVLVVDDNLDAASTLAELLETSGYTVATAPDASTALRLRGDAEFDVYILDIGLPDMTGYELAERIQGIAGSTRPFLLALTGYGQPEDRQLSQAAGFDAHLVKPVDPRSLLSMLASIPSR